MGSIGTWVNDESLTTNLRGMRLRLKMGSMHTMEHVRLIGGPLNCRLWPTPDSDRFQITNLEDTANPQCLAVRVGEYRRSQSVPGVYHWRGWL